MMWQDVMNHICLAEQEHPLAMDKAEILRMGFIHNQPHDEEAKTIKQYHFGARATPPPPSASSSAECALSSMRDFRRGDPNSYWKRAGWKLCWVFWQHEGEIPEEADKGININPKR